jgi:transmembrane sensor
VAAYLEGDSSAPEQMVVAQWVAADPRRASIVGELAKAWGMARGTSPFAQGIDDTTEGWRRLALRTGITSNMANTRQGRRDVPIHGLVRRHAGSHRVAHPARLAAGFVAALAVAATLYVMPVRRITAAQRYATTTGQRMTVTLANGNRVVLAPQTTVQIEAGDRRTSQTVSIVGEAYFTVRGAANAPFMVRTGNSLTRVLGTAFDVRYYPGDRGTRVIVTQGRVEMIRTDRHEQPITLGAGMLAQTTDSAIVTRKIGTAPYTEWTNGRLVFDEAPVSDVLRTLERWYGYRFRLGTPSLGLRHITATFESKTSAEALSTLKLLLNVDMTFTGDSVTLHARSRNSSSPRLRREARDTSSTFTEVGR